MTIGNRIKNLRLQIGLSQSELAEMMGTIKQTIYKYETGVITNIPSDKIEQLARIFKVSPSYIMGWDDNNSTTNVINHKKKITLSSHELNVIEAYRNKPDMQPVVDKILDVNKEEKTYTRFVAARSENGQSPMRIEEASKEAHDDLANAPETDMDF